MSTAYKIINPHVKNTLRRRFHIWLCRRFGHIQHGPYYGMQQAHCRRCGKKFFYKDVPENYVKPWGEYE